MKNYKILTAFLIFVLATMACGIQINLPSQIKTGSTVTDEFAAEIPDSAGPYEVTLSLGAGEIDINPGAENSLISGTVRYNVPDFKPELTTQGDSIFIEQGNLNVSGLPNFDEKVINEWDFKIANEPINLFIRAGAYQGRYELGGLSLNRLEINDGAADVDLGFSKPNTIELKSLDYSTGASSVTLEGLGNANPTTMTFRSGAGSYRLEFTGKMQHDMEVLVESGISSVVIIVPEGVPAEVRFDGGMTDINYFGDWNKEGSYYTQDGEGYKIDIRVKMGAGNLELRNK